MLPVSLVTRRRAMSSSSPIIRRLSLEGPFDLARTAAFSFGPKAREAFDGTYRMAFCVDGYQTSAAVAITQPSPEQLSVEIAGDAVDPDVVVRQVARILSVDVDSRGWVTLAEQDEVLAPLVAAAPGLRPPLFSSAYEALAWSVLSARRPRAQMTKVRNALARAAGVGLTVAGEQLWAFPLPEAMLTVSEFPGLNGQKLERLHGVAAAAAAGGLDTAVLRSMPVGQAEASALKLDGIGPFYAQLLTVRTLGHTDLLPSGEAKLLAVLGARLGRDEPVSQAEFAVLAERWRPWRTWASVHLRAVDLPAERIDV
jgi:DNA-3-methyladenine glycosylase II